MTFSSKKAYRIPQLNFWYFEVKFQKKQTLKQSRLTISQTWHNTKTLLKGAPINKLEILLPYYIK